jgi:hypothetical protein
LGLRDLVSRLCGSFGEIRNQADLYAEWESKLHVI